MFTICFSNFIFAASYMLIVLAAMVANQPVLAQVTVRSRTNVSPSS